ncbi:chromosomal replication initiator protein DnaA [Actinomyces gaoshouyii]|uniref:Chromosomal replication initiator protein DnaA n=1 Tax=Actinomyces gaoshouyii TaxID=1960083 RepID=A0A8H9H7A0_9ACTO|nr:chromosomal replication initiator protein DnaA [Actinomyces gaoshouyii]GGO95026.1 hypothetical protein GCM10011612_01880 [Actinomyces gaoshouyii]
MLEDAVTKWHSALEVLAASGELGQGKVSIIRMTRVIDVDGTLVLVAGSSFAKDIIDKSRDPIGRALMTAWGKEVPFEVMIDTSGDPVPPPAPPIAPPVVHPTAMADAGSAPSTLSPPSVPSGVPLAQQMPSALMTGRTDFAMGENGSSTGSTGSNPFAATAPAGSDGSTLNPRYTFDAYVTGSSNRFAHAASIAVAEAPARAYNPLFIYGGSGLGKTHLLHAIGHYARTLDPTMRIKYVNSEEFTADFIAAVRDNRDNGSLDSFKRRYRDVDILLVDDIQFLADKEQTLEEFFHTFNALHSAGKQVVLTADQPPKAMNNLDERLRSRFEWGLLADVQPPDLETRMAILSLKARAEGLDLPMDVLEYIASRVTTNIRELEGALIRVTAFASLNQQTIDQTLAEMVLRDIISDPASEEITTPLIMAQTADYFGITVDDLCSANRSRLIVHARHIAMYLCRELTDLSLPKIGREFGGRDHTTVMSADKKIRQQMAERRSTFNQVTEMTSRIKQAALEQN